MRIAAQLGLGDDRRYSSEVSHRFALRRGLTGSDLRRSSQSICCRRKRTWTFPFQASRPGGEHPGGFPSRPAPGGEIRCRDRSQALNRPLDTGDGPSPDCASDAPSPDPLGKLHDRFSYSRDDGVAHTFCDEASQLRPPCSNDGSNHLPTPNSQLLSQKMVTGRWAGTIFIEYGLCPKSPPPGSRLLFFDKRKFR